MKAASKAAGGKTREPHKDMEGEVLSISMSKVLPDAGPLLSSLADLHGFPPLEGAAPERLFGPALWACAAGILLAAFLELVRFRR